MNKLYNAKTVTFRDELDLRSLIGLWTMHVGHHIRGAGSGGYCSLRIRETTEQEARRSKPRVAVTTAVRAGNVVTVTAIEHGLNVGDLAILSHVAYAGAVDFNGAHVVTGALTANTFSFAQIGANDNTGTGGVLQGVRQIPVTLEGQNLKEGAQTASYVSRWANLPPAIYEFTCTITDGAHYLLLSVERAAAGPQQVNAIGPLTDAELLIHFTQTGLVGALFASLTTDLAGDNNDLLFTARTPGAAGNNISVEYVDPGVAESSLAVLVEGVAIQVCLETENYTLVSTAAEVLSAIELEPDASALVSVALAPGNTGAGMVLVMESAYLSGGLDTLASTKALPEMNAPAWSECATGATGEAVSVIRAAEVNRQHCVTAFEACLVGAAAVGDILIQLLANPGEEGEILLWQTAIGSGVPRGERVGIVFDNPLLPPVGYAVGLCADATAGGAVLLNLSGITLKEVS